jgi:hypothetical protein
VLGDEALYARLKANATKKAESFDMIVQAKRMVGVYEQAMADKKADRKIQVDVSRIKANVKARLAAQG